MSAMYDVVSPRIWNPAEVINLTRSSSQSFMSVRNDMQREAMTPEQQAVVSNLQRIVTVLIDLEVQVRAYPQGPFYSINIFNQLQSHMGEVKEELAVANFSAALNAQFWSASKSADNLLAYY